MSRDEFPRGFLCQRLRGHVDRKRLYCRVLRLHRLHGGIIPIAFAENAWHRGRFDNGNDRRGEDHTLHGTPMF